MEIKGDEFIKTVQLRQEKDDIQKRLNELDQLDNTPTPQEHNPYEEEIIQTESELDDIMLQAPIQNKQDNKKKYIVLGLLLVVLFLISLLVIRFLNNGDDKTSETSKKETNISQDKVLDNDNIEQQYQKIINQKLNNIKEQNKQTELEEKTAKDALDINAIEKEEQKLPQVKKQTNSTVKEKLKKDIFGMEEEKANKIKEVLKRSTPKVIVKTPKVVEKTTKKQSTLFDNVKVSKTTSAVSKKGAYIQIGSFTKTIDKKYIKNLDDKNIKYILHKAVIKGKTYTKVLVGPYSSKSEAKKETTSIRKKLNITSSYVLSL